MTTFAHFADTHIGSWRDPKLNQITMKGFQKSIQICYEKQVDFILIAGDFFNTNFPSVERLKETAKILKEIKEKQIPIYIIPGSHDYSPTGKTMIDVFEQAGLLINVMKGKVNEHQQLQLDFTTDEKTGIKITGIAGRKGMLDRQYYENLDLDYLEDAQGPKIFMFHTAITELKPKDLEKMESQPLSFLPQNFTYYAGGHVHQTIERDFPNHKNVVFPGPMFPNNFRELEKLKHGGFYIVNHENQTITKEYIPIKLHETLNIFYKVENQTPQETIKDIEEKILQEDIKDKIILIRIEGKLKEGKLIDLNLKELSEKLLQQGAYFVMKNTTKLNTTTFQEVRKEIKSNIEETIIEEHIDQSNLKLPKEEQKELTLKAFQILSAEKKEGERTTDFEERLIEDVKKILGIYD